MRYNAALAFDPKAFLTKIESGKTTREYRSRQVVFSQGEGLPGRSSSRISCRATFGSKRTW